MPRELIIVANSHGEIQALVRPLVETLQSRANAFLLTLVIPPCQFASGKEVEIAKTFTGITRIVPPKETVRWIWWNHSPKEYSRMERGAVLYIGGDPLYPLILSKRLGYVPLAYLNHYTRWAKRYRKCFLPDPNLQERYTKDGTLPEQLEVIGDLMVESMSSLPEKKTARKQLHLSPDDPVITFLPGSHTFQIRHLTPLFLNVAGRIRDKVPNTQFIFALSPFTHVQDFKKIVIPAQTRGRVESFGAFVQKDGRPVLRTNRVTVHLVEDHTAAFASSDFCITSPGTNTAQIAAAGISMIVGFPLQYPDDIPLEGLAHYFTQIPALGRFLRRKIIQTALKKNKFFALPNMRAGREIAPELVGNVTPEQLATAALSLLQDPAKREEIGAQLKLAMGEKGAAASLSIAIEKFLEEEKP